MMVGVMNPDGTEQTSPYAMTIPGHVRTVLNMSISNESSSALTYITISTGISTITLDGLNVASGRILTISHADNGLLQIKAGSENAYGKQAAGGSTDLYVIRVLRKSALRQIAVSLPTSPVMGGMPNDFT